MLKYADLKTLFLNNYLMRNDGQCFYGYLNLKKSDLKALNLKVKNLKEKIMIAFGASNEDLVLIPYDNLNQEFNLNQKILLMLKELDGNLKKDILTLSLNGKTLLVVKIPKDVVKDNNYKIDLITFVNRFKPQEFFNGQDLSLENKEEITNKVIEETSKPAEVKENIPVIQGDGTYHFMVNLIPSTLLENPTESQIKYLKMVKAEITGNKEKVVVTYNNKNILLLKNRITNVIVRKSADLVNGEVWVQSHNENLFKIIFNYDDMADSNLKANMQNFINSFFHSGEGLDNIILAKAKEKRSNYLGTIFWLIILMGIILGIYYFLK